MARHSFSVLSISCLSFSLRAFASSSKRLFLSSRLLLATSSLNLSISTRASSSLCFLSCSVRFLSAFRMEAPRSFFSFMKISRACSACTPFPGVSL
uniref:Secreted protein n=1 Tax=Anguilla anguilla TaxID=7936 RepID=A0A0E9XX79_ANGAN